MGRGEDEAGDGGSAERLPSLAATLGGWKLRARKQDQGVKVEVEVEAEGRQERALRGARGELER